YIMFSYPNLDSVNDYLTSLGLPSFDEKPVVL
ncbi:unnamed protein product, partial [marine sediment metagenome]